MQSKNKMSDVIKSILEVTDGVLGRPATRGQVIQVIELIESFDKPEPKAATATKVKPAKAKAKPRRKGYLSWKDKSDFFDQLSNGVVMENMSYNTFSKLFPGWEKMNRSSLRNRFDYEMKKRGLPGCTLTFNDTLSDLTIKPKR